MVYIIFIVPSLIIITCFWTIERHKKKSGIKRESSEATIKQVNSFFGWSKYLYFDAYNIEISYKDNKGTEHQATVPYFTIVLHIPKVDESITINYIPSTPDKPFIPINYTIKILAINAVLLLSFVGFLDLVSF